MEELKKRTVSVAFILVIVSTITVFWNGFMRGSFFQWTVNQPEYWNAVVEMAGAFVIYCTVLLTDYQRPRTKWLLCAAILLVYTYFHVYFFASIIIAVYAAQIYLTGCFICSALHSRLMARDDFSEPHFRMVSGISGIILIVAAASALKIGTPEKIRVILLIVFAVELMAIFRKRPPILKGLSLKGDSSTHTQNKPGLAEATCIAAILTSITICACRANMGTDYDSLWYGYRSHLVLAPETGIFDNPYLLSCVYTYPKGIEVLALPFSGLQTLSLITALNIVFAILTIHAVYKAARIWFSNAWSLFAAVVVAVTPSIMNMTTTAKSDNATLYLQVVALYYAFQAIREHSSFSVWKAISILLLSLAFKPSSLIFSILIMAVLMLMYVFRIRSFKRKELWVITVGILPLVALWTRTWVLTGIPMGTLLNPVWKVLGFTSKAPYEMTSSGSSSLTNLLSLSFVAERFVRLINIMFSPNQAELSHVQIAWWGPLTTLSWLLSCVSLVAHPRATLDRMKSDTMYCFHTVFFVMLTGLSGGTLLLLNRPDGNYYGLMCIASVLQLLFEAQAWRQGIKAQHITVGITVVVCNMLLLLATSWSWTLGLTPINLDMKGYYNHEENYIMPKIETNGLTDIYIYLKESNQTRRVMGFVDDAETFFLLPVIGDAYYQQMIWAPNSLKSVEDLVSYMECAKVDGILVENSFLASNTTVCNQLLELGKKGFIRLEMESERYALLSVDTSREILDSKVMDYLTLKDTEKAGE